MGMTTFYETIINGYIKFDGMATAKIDIYSLPFPFLIVSLR